MTLTPHQGSRASRSAILDDPEFAPVTFNYGGGRYHQCWLPKGETPGPEFAGRWAAVLNAPGGWRRWTILVGPNSFLVERIAEFDERQLLRGTPANIIGDRRGHSVDMHDRRELSRFGEFIEL